MKSNQILSLLESVYRSQHIDSNVLEKLQGRNYLRDIFYFYNKNLAEISKISDSWGKINKIEKDQFFWQRLEGVVKYANYINDSKTRICNEITSVGKYIFLRQPLLCNEKTNYFNQSKQSLMVSIDTQQLLQPYSSQIIKLFEEVNKLESILTIKANQSIRLSLRLSSAIQKVKQQIIQLQNSNKQITVYSSPFPEDCFTLSKKICFIVNQYKQIPWALTRKVEYPRTDMDTTQKIQWLVKYYQENCALQDNLKIAQQKIIKAHKFSRIKDEQHLSKQLSLLSPIQSDYRYIERLQERLIQCTKNYLWKSQNYDKGIGQSCSQLYSQIQKHIEKMKQILKNFFEKEQGNMTGFLIDLEEWLSFYDQKGQYNCYYGNEQQKQKNGEKQKRIRQKIKQKLDLDGDLMIEIGRQIRTQYQSDIKRDIQTENIIELMKKKKETNGELSLVQYFISIVYQKIQREFSIIYEGSNIENIHNKNTYQEISQVTLQNKELNAKIADLENQITQHKQLNGSWAQEKTSLGAKIADLENQITQHKQLNGSWAQEKTSLGAKIADLENQITQHKKNSTNVLIPKQIQQNPLYKPKLIINEAFSLTFHALLSQNIPINQIMGQQYYSSSHSHNSCPNHQLEYYSKYSKLCQKIKSLQEKGLYLQKLNQNKQQQIEKKKETLSKLQNEIISIVNQKESIEQAHKKQNKAEEVKQKVGKQAGKAYKAQLKLVKQDWKKFMQQINTDATKAKQQIKVLSESRNRIEKQYNQKLREITKLNQKQSKLVQNIKKQQNSLKSMAQQVEKAKDISQNIQTYKRQTSQLQKLVLNLKLSKSKLAQQIQQMSVMVQQKAILLAQKAEQQKKYQQLLEKVRNLQKTVVQLQSKKNKLNQQILKEKDELNFITNQKHTEIIQFEKLKNEQKQQKRNFMAEQQRLIQKNKKLEKNINDYQNHQINQQVNHQYSKFFVGEVISNDTDLQYAVEQIQNIQGKIIRKTKLLYSYPLMENLNPHQSVDGIGNYLVVLKLENKNSKGQNYIISCYSEQPLLNNGILNNGKGFIASVTNQKSFRKKEGKNNSRVTQYNDYYFIFGNSEIRWKIKSGLLETNLGHNFRSFEYDSKTPQIMIGTVETTAKINSYEIFEILFKEGY